MADDSNCEPEEEISSMFNMVLSIDEYKNDNIGKDEILPDGIKFPTCIVHIDNTEVKTWVDTCAGYTIMGNKMF